MLLHIFVVFAIWIHHEFRDDHTQKTLGDESTFEFALSSNASVGQTCSTTKSLACRPSLFVQVICRTRILQVSLLSLLRFYLRISLRSKLIRTPASLP